MAGKPAAPARTPARPGPSQTGSSTGKQQSILGFFSKSAGTASKSSPATPLSSRPLSSAVKKDGLAQCLTETTKSNSMSNVKRSVNITPVPSSDIAGPWSSQENRDSSAVKVPRNVLPSPVTPAKTVVKQAGSKLIVASSPSRKVSDSISPSTHTSSS